MKRHPQIMVVDDDRRMLRMLKRTLEPNGYGVTTATDSSSALTMLEKHTPDLVILDTMMPQLDGFQTLNLVRQHSNTPIVILTARSEADQLRKHHSTNTDDYVRMPFQTGELVNRIKAKLH